MLSPFPGIATYLENPTCSPNIHPGLISEMQADLNRQLRLKYHADVEERLYLSEDASPVEPLIIPDVYVISQEGKSPRL
jgi:hypothetical protein